MVETCHVYSKVWMIMRHFKSLSLMLLLTGIIFGVSTGCRISSSDSVSRNVGINVAGVYRGPNGENLVRSNTGAPIRDLNVIQDGSRLQAIDNNGLMFRGNIGSVEGAGGDRSASFTLSGLTSTGAEGIISGTFRVSGDTGTMTGTWAEPSLFSTVSGTASISGQQPEPINGNDNDNDNDSNNNDSDNDNNNNITVEINGNSGENNNAGGPGTP